MRFSNFKNQGTVPFVVYADLECMMKPGAKESQEHIPHNAAYYIHCAYDNTLSEYKNRRGFDCIKWLIEELRELSVKVESRIKNVIPMVVLNQAQRDRRMRAKNCYICENHFYLRRKNATIIVILRVNIAGLRTTAAI